MERIDEVDQRFLFYTRDQLLDILKQQRNLLKVRNEQVQGMKYARTEEVREGSFIKRIIRHNGKKTERLTRIKRNEKKVTLFFLGNIEFYLYPYQSDETVYARIGKEITGLNKYELKGLLAVHNRLNWVVNGGIKKAIRGESNSAIAKEIIDAWNAGHKEELNLMREYSESKRNEMDKAEKHRKEFEKSMPLCVCGQPATWYFGTKSGEPLRLCINCQRVYYEESGVFVGMRLEVKTDNHGDINE